MTENEFWRMIFFLNNFCIGYLFFLPFFLGVVIGSYCFWASGFFVFSSVGRAYFCFEKTFVCDKKEINYIQKS